MIAYTIVNLMLLQRIRRWFSIKNTTVHPLAFVGYGRDIGVNELYFIPPLTPIL